MSGRRLDSLTSAAEILGPGSRDEQLERLRIQLFSDKTEFRRQVALRYNLSEEMVIISDQVRRVGTGYILVPLPGGVEGYICLQPEEIPWWRVTAVVLPSSLFNDQHPEWPAQLITRLYAPGKIGADGRYYCGKCD